MEQAQGTEWSTPAPNLYAMKENGAMLQTALEQKAEIDRMIHSLFRAIIYVAAADIYVSNSTEKNDIFSPLLIFIVLYLPRVEIYR